MIDLWDLVLRYYYSPHAKGSNSIKRILPAIIHDSEYLRAKYSRPIYGKTKQVTSLNVDSHVWIRAECNNDPYKTLAPLFTDYDTDVLDKMIVGLDEIADGGAGFTAREVQRRHQVSRVRRMSSRRASGIGPVPRLKR